MRSYFTRAYLTTTSLTGTRYLRTLAVTSQSFAQNAILILGKNVIPTFWLLASYKYYVPLLLPQTQQLRPFNRWLGAKAVRFQEGCSRSQRREAALRSRSGGVQQRVSLWRSGCVARPVGSLLASLVAPLLCIASQAWRPGVTCCVNWIKFSIHVCKKWKHQLETSMLLPFCVNLYWYVLTWFLMWHFWLPADFLKLPSMYCF